MARLDVTKIRAGQILHMRGGQKFGRTIRKVLSIRQSQPCWGSHDAIIVRVPGMGYCVGESVSPVARLIPLAEFNRRFQAGEFELRVYEPVNLTLTQMYSATTWWVTYVCGSLYDWAAFPRLLLKATLGDYFDTVAGWEWAHWCTEGIATAYLKGAGVDVWRKKNPTPLTTEKRAMPGGTLLDVTSVVVIQ